MTPHEEQYKSTVNRIAIALLFFLLMYHVEGVILSALSLLLSPLNEVLYHVIYRLTSALLYTATFCFPVLLFRHLPSSVPEEPMRLSYRMPRETPAYLFFGISVVSVAASVNAALVGIFDYSDFSDEVLWDTSASTNIELVLLFLTLAVVPAFVEELLFRGMVLSNLLPYGKTVAILGSALLFGIMHQNIEQLLYATAAGLVLGWIYVRTQSIWPCVLLHFVNNFRSVAQTALLERLSHDTADAILYITEGAVLLLGVISGIYLFLRERAAGAREEASAQSNDCPIAPERKLRLFFTAPMIIFFIGCVLQMLSLLLMAVFLY